MSKKGVCSIYTLAKTSNGGRSLIPFTSKKGNGSLNKKGYSIFTARSQQADSVIYSRAKNFNTNATKTIAAADLHFRNKKPFCFSAKFGEYTGSFMNEAGKTMLNNHDIGGFGRDQSLILLEQLGEAGDLIGALQLAQRMKKAGLLVTEASSTNNIPTAHFIYKDGIVMEKLFQAARATKSHKDILQMALAILCEYKENHYENQAPLSEDTMVKMLQVYTLPKFYESPVKDLLGSSGYQFFKSAGYSRSDDFSECSPEFVKAVIRLLGYYGNNLKLQEFLSNISSNPGYQDFKMEIAISSTYSRNTEFARSLYLELLDTDCDIEKLAELARALATGYAELGLTEPALKIWAKFKERFTNTNSNQASFLDDLVNLRIYASAMRRWVPQKIFTENFHFNNTYRAAIMDPVEISLSHEDPGSVFGWRKILRESNLYKSYGLDLSNIGFDTNTDAVIRFHRVALECTVLGMILYPKIISLSQVKECATALRSVSGRLSQEDYEMILWGCAFFKGQIPYRIFEHIIFTLKEATDIYKTQISNRLFLPALFASLPSSIKEQFPTRFRENGNLSYKFIPTTIQVLSKVNQYTSAYTYKILQLSNKYNVDWSIEMELVFIWHLALKSNYKKAISRIGPLSLKALTPRDLGSEITLPDTALAKKYRGVGFYLHIYWILASNPETAAFVISVLYPQMAQEFPYAISDKNILLALVDCCTSARDPTFMMKLLGEAKSMGVKITRSIEESTMMCFFTSHRTIAKGIQLLDYFISTSDNKCPRFRPATYTVLMTSFARTNLSVLCAENIFSIWVYNNFKTNKLPLKLADLLRALDLPKQIQGSENGESTRYDNRLQTQGTRDFWDILNSNDSQTPKNDNLHQLNNSAGRFSHNEPIVPESGMVLLSLLSECYLRSGSFDKADQVIEYILADLNIAQTALGRPLIWDKFAAVAEFYWDKAVLVNKNDQRYFLGNSLQIVEIFFKGYVFSFVRDNCRIDYSSLFGSADLDLSENSTLNVGIRKKLVATPEWGYLIIKLSTTLNNPENAALLSSSRLLCEQNGFIHTLRIIDHVTSNS